MTSFQSLGYLISGIWHYWPHLPSWNQFFSCIAWIQFSYASSASFTALFLTPLSLWIFPFILVFLCLFLHAPPLPWLHLNPVSPALISSLRSWTVFPNYIEYPAGPVGGWSQLTPAQKSWLCISLPTSAVSDFHGASLKSASGRNIYTIGNLIQVGLSFIFLASQLTFTSTTLNETFCR